MANIPNVMWTGRSGMMSSKTAIATTGHNITNANTEGFSRQRVAFKNEVAPPNQRGSNHQVGQGVSVASIDRVNDEYLEKQVRNGNKNLAHFEEKDIHLTQVEDIFNEMNGDGLNRLMANFFNEFRKLANDPNSEAVRQSVRESSQAMVTDFKRLRQEVVDVGNHIDARIEGYCREVNSLLSEVAVLNHQVKQVELGNGPSANDLKDQRDLALKKLATYIDVKVHKDEHGNLTIDMPGMGPLVTGTHAETFSVERTPGDDQGKREGSYDVKCSATANNTVTHTLKGGKLGALLEIRDKTLSATLSRMDDLAYGVSTAVNEIHRQGFTRGGAQGVDFFKDLSTKDRAAEYIGLSDAIHANANNIAAAATPDAPSDNRVAIALSGIQGLRIMNEGKSTVDDWYNSIVSDVGVLSSRNKSDLNQQRSINTQLGKMRDSLSGVSIDEEVANMLQYQHTYDASAKVIQVADDMLNTVLNLKRG